MNKRPLMDQLRRIITAQLRVSELKDLDREQYATILAYVAEKIGINPVRDIKDEQLDAYLDRAQQDLNPTRFSKVKVVLHIFRDWKAQRPSSPCPGIVVSCPYCDSPAPLSDGSHVRGYQGLNLNLYVCANYPKCDAYVGVHKGDNWPRGTLANAQLRYWRRQAHSHFDRLWREGSMSRSQAYASIQDIMGTKEHQSHIAMFNVEQCQRMIALLTENPVPENR